MDDIKIINFMKREALAKKDAEENPYEEKIFYELVYNLGEMSTREIKGVMSKSTLRKYIQNLKIKGFITNEEGWIYETDFGRDSILHVRCRFLFSEHVKKEIPEIMKSFTSLNDAVNNYFKSDDEIEDVTIIRNTDDAKSVPANGITITYNNYAEKKIMQMKRRFMP